MFDFVFVTIIYCVVVVAVVVAYLLLLLLWVPLCAIRMRALHMNPIDPYTNSSSNNNNSNNNNNNNNFSKLSHTNTHASIHTCECTALVEYAADGVDVVVVVVAVVAGAVGTHAVPLQVY